MAQNHWLSLRAFRLQSECFLANALRSEKSPVPADLPVLIRYRTTAENAFHKAHNELVKAKKQRLNSEIGFEPQSYGHEVPDVPEPDADEPPNQPQKTPVTPISTVPPTRARD